MGIKPPIRHKYKARPTEIDGWFFPSQKEGRYYQELKLKVKAGYVLFFLCQVPIRLLGNVKMVVDFLEFHTDGTVHFVDTKGKRLRSYIDKKKMVESIYPFDIEEK